MRLATLAIALSTLQITSASAEPAFILLPGDGGQVAVSGGSHFSFSDTGGSASLNLFGPLRQTANGWLLYELGFSAALDSNYDVSASSAYGGILYRYNASDNSILGFNTYIDGRQADGGGDFIGLVSLGVEYEYRFAGYENYIQLGANAYHAFDDYTDVARFGVLSAAPRSGHDGYLTIGRDFDGFGISGTVSIFNYYETPNALALNGYRVDTEIEVWQGLPAGMSATFGLGVRDDNLVGGTIEYMANVDLNWTFGNRGTTTVSTSNCAVNPDAQGVARVECGDSLSVSTMGARGAAPSSNRPATRVSAPRRNLGYGSAGAPIEASAPPPSPPPATGTISLYASVGKRSDRLPLGGGTISFSTSSSALSNGLGSLMLTTEIYSATTPAVAVPAGVYTHAINLPSPDWTIDQLFCASKGGSTFTISPDYSSATVTLAAGDAVVCSYNVDYTDNELPEGLAKPQA